MSRRSTGRRRREPKAPRRGRANLPPDLAALPAEFWDGAEVTAPTPKRAISLRVDEDVFDWFRRRGPRYQTRMNAVLRMYVHRMRKHA